MKRSVQQGGCDLYGKHLTPVHSVSLAVRRIGDTGILTNEACGLRDASPSVNTSTTLMHHKTPISGECEVSCPGGLILPAVWPGVEAVVCVIRLSITSHQTGCG